MAKIIFQKSTVFQPIVDQQTIHVWQVELPKEIGSIEAWLPLLSTDEIAKASRFRQIIHSQRFIIIRGAIRKIISHYLKIESTAIEFHYNRYEKPFLNPACNPLRLEFNLSHSHEIALVAVTQLYSIGIDVEYIRKSIKEEELITQFFSPYEISEFHKLPSEQRTEAFYRLWTCKEAFIKAQGLGLSFPLNEFDISCPSSVQPTLLRIQNNEKTAKEWILRTFAPHDDYLATVAANKIVSQIRLLPVVSLLSLK